MPRIRPWFLLALLPLWAFSPNSDGCYGDRPEPPVPMEVEGEVLVEYPSRALDGSGLGARQVLGLSRATVQLEDSFGELGTAEVVAGAWRATLRTEGRNFANGVRARFQGERSAPIDLHANRRHHRFAPFVVRGNPGRLTAYPNPATPPVFLRMELDGRFGGVWDVVVRVDDALLPPQVPALGRVLFEGQLAGGSHELVWDGEIDGQPVPAGLYRASVEFPFQHTTWYEFVEVVR